MQMRAEGVGGSAVTVVMAHHGAWGGREDCYSEHRFCTPSVREGFLPWGYRVTEHSTLKTGQMRLTTESELRTGTPGEGGDARGRAGPPRAPGNKVNSSGKQALWW